MVPPGGVVCLAHVCTRDQPGNIEVEDRLRALIPPEGQRFGIRSEIMMMKDDDPWSGILHIANRFGADAVCLANRGHTELGEAFLRSTIRELLRKIQLPVLVVHTDGG
jgi:nucleotide-binding universal stress UspA family protein